MGQAVNIVLADALATPVNHTFIPQGRDLKGNYIFEDQSGASSVGFNRIALRLERPMMAPPGGSSGDRTIKVHLGVYTPVLETLGTNDNGMLPPPTVAYVPTFQASFLVSERSSEQERKNSRKYMQFLLADTQVINMIEKLINVT